MALLRFALGFGWTPLEGAFANFSVESELVRWYRCIVQLDYCRPASAGQVGMSRKMIKNERQYSVAKAHARRFAASVRAIEEGIADNLAADPLIAKAQKDAMESQIADLENELRLYEKLTGRGAT